MTIPLRFLFQTKDPRSCPCCGALYHQALEWVDNFNKEELNETFPLIWGNATLVRLGYPEEEWADPVWEQDFHLVRQGRDGYTDHSRGYEVYSELGDAHMLKLMEKLKVSIEKEEILTTLHEEGALKFGEFKLKSAKK